jgi:hypothetical protein
MPALLTPKTLSQRSAYERTRRLCGAPFVRMQAEVESLGEEVER